MHSTEIALLKVQNALLRNLDDVKTTVLVLLDLSAAFDTLDHSGVICWKIGMASLEMLSGVCLISDESTANGLS